MLKTKNVALLDIGSKTVDLFYGNAYGNNCNVVAMGSESYSGFTNGEFFEPDKLKDVIDRVVRQVENRTGKAVRRLYVAVPGEFTKVVIRRVSENFQKPQQIKDSDIVRLLKRAEELSDNSEYVNINTALIGYETDSFRQLGTSSEELLTRSIDAIVSSVLCERNFIDVMNGIFEYSGIKEVKYISSSFAEAQYLTDEKERDKGVLLCDVGYLTTTVMLAKGDGLMDMRSFSLGGAHIAADYTMAYDLDFQSASRLFDKVNLKLAPKGFEDYRVETKDGILKFNMSEVNNITFDRLDMIVDMIKRCIASFKGNCREFTPIFFTGGGVCGCKGAFEYIAFNLQRKYDVRVPNVVKYNVPWYSSSVSSLSLACKIEESNSFVRGFVNKLFGGRKNG